MDQVPLHAANHKKKKNKVKLRLAQTVFFKNSFLGGWKIISIFKIISSTSSWIRRVDTGDDVTSKSEVTLANQKPEKKREWCSGCVDHILLNIMLENEVNKKHLTLTFLKNESDLLEKP